MPGEEVRKMVMWEWRLRPPWALEGSSSPDGEAGSGAQRRLGAGRHSGCTTRYSVSGEAALLLWAAGRTLNILP